MLPRGHNPHLTRFELSGRVSFYNPDLLLRVPHNYFFYKFLRGKLPHNFGLLHNDFNLLSGYLILPCHLKSFLLFWLKPIHLVVFFMPLSDSILYHSLFFFVLPVHFDLSFLQFMSHQFLHWELWRGSINQMPPDNKLGNCLLIYPHCVPRNLRQILFLLRKFLISLERHNHSHNGKLHLDPIRLYPLD